MNKKKNDHVRLETMQDLKELAKELYKKDEKGQRNNLTGYSLYTFLETELDRINKLIDFFENKLPLQIESSQANRLIAQQEIKNSAILSDLLSKITPVESDFQKKMSRIFNSTFS